MEQVRHLKIWKIEKEAPQNTQTTLIKKATNPGIIEKRLVLLKTFLTVNFPKANLDPIWVTETVLQICFIVFIAVFELLSRKKNVQKKISTIVLMNNLKNYFNGNSDS